jgi:tetratricopeptide (TPR) repeat protein
MSHAPQPDDLRLFLQACYEHGRSEWGVATALFLGHDPEAVLVLADTLLEWNHPAESRDQYRRALAALPGDLRVQRGLIGALAAAGEGEPLLDAIESALAEHPEDATLARACSGALATLSRPPPRALRLMETLFAAWPAVPELAEALARGHLGRPAEQRAPLATLVDRLRTGEIPLDAPGIERTLVRSARLAHAATHTDLALELCDFALLVAPGTLPAMREKASLDLEAGRLDSARRHLEVLSFVDADDKGAGMTLARLLFEQLGQPTAAADVVRRTYPGSKPIEGVEILAAEAYLQGRPSEALALFQSIARSPAITPDTYLTVARIAYAAAQDELARKLYDTVLEKLAKDDPRRPRAHWLRTVRLAEPAPTKAGAP